MSSPPPGLKSAVLSGHNGFTTVVATANAGSIGNSASVNTKPGKYERLNRRLNRMGRLPLSPHREGPWMRALPKAAVPSGAAAMAEYRSGFILDSDLAGRFAVARARFCCAFPPTVSRRGAARSPPLVCIGPSRCCGPLRATTGSLVRRARDLLHDRFAFPVAAGEDLVAFDHALVRCLQRVSS